MIQRQNNSLGLADIPVLIADTTTYSQYFQISELPFELTSGKNSFKIYGDNNLLKKGTEILIEVTDVNNKPIYHHVNKYVDSSGRRLISIYVYEDTPPGLCKLTILGVATKRPGGNPVSEFWKNRYNVKWTTTIPVLPAKINTTEVVFQTVPGATIKEVIRPYSAYSYTDNLVVTSSTKGTITYTKTSNDEAFIDIEGAEFTFDMSDMQFTSINHGYEFPEGVTLDQDENDTFTPYIMGIINNTRVQVQPWSMNVNTEILFSPSGLYERPVPDVIKDGAPTPPVTVQTIHQPETFTTSDFTMTWTQAGSFVSSSQNSQSYASIILKNIDPIAGDIKSVKTYFKSQGFSGYALAGETDLEDNNLFTDTGSLFPFDSMGKFITSSVITSYWESSSFGLISSSGFPKIVQSDFPIMSSITISGSELITDTSHYIVAKSKLPVNLFKANEYAITMEIQAEKTPVQTAESKIEIFISGSNTGGDPEFGEKLTTLRSELDRPNVTQMTINGHQVSYINTTADGTRNPNAGSSRQGGSGTNRDREVVSQPLVFESNTVSPLPPTNGKVERQLLDIPFIPPVDTNVHLVFKVSNGKWHIGDVAIRGAKQTGFTPNHTFIEVPIPTAQEDDILDFKFEFYNPAAVRSNLIMEKFGVNFTGSNTYINGSNNYLDGMLTIGQGFLIEGFTNERVVGDDGG